MFQLSTLFSGVLLATAMAVAANKSGIWHLLSAKEKLLTVGALVFFASLTLTGGYYVLRKRIAVGVVHGVLLAAVAIYGVKTGLSILNNRSIMGGRGPDANPAAGIVYGFGLGYATAGFLAGAMALSFIPLLWSVKKQPNQAPEPIRAKGPHGSL